MKTLMVMTLSNQPVGTIIQRDDGNLEIAGANPALEAELRRLVDALSARPLPYRIGERKETPHGVEHVTYAKMCRPGDPDFLNALKDALNRESLLGVRIKGVIS